VIHSSGQAELACPPSFGRERLVRTQTVKILINVTLMFRHYAVVSILHLANTYFKNVYPMRERRVAVC
jgi:hypothetical protein